jgi:tripartite-type tricarboxylate transporter receptor subunit TctC
LLSRRHVLTSAAALAAAGLARPAQSQTTPKTARILVGFPPGGSSDLAARLLADRMKGYAGAVIVENKPGAGGRLALEYLKTAPADGSTFALTPMSMVVIFPHTHKALGYDPLADFLAVTTVTEFPFVVSVGPLVPATVTTLPEFIAWCRQNPAQAMYATSSAGSTLHLTGVALARAARFEFQHVPYNGAPASQADVIGGRVAANIGVLGSALPQIQGGRLRALATSGPKRSPFLPEVPTFTEAGFSEVTATEWQGLFVPVKTPPPVVEALYRAARAALAGPEIRAEFGKLAFEVKPTTPEEFAALMRKDFERWREIVKASGFVAGE